MAYKVNWEILRKFCIQIYQSAGLSEDNAFTIADGLVMADLRGVPSHGVSRMDNYVKRISSGVVSKTNKIIIEQEYPASAVLDGCNSMGMLAGKYAMDFCVKKAEKSGLCFVTVKHSNHFGMASIYVAQAAEANMIGYCSTNAPQNIAPWGSSKAYMGTNPIAIACPAVNAPIILDMAPSIVAMGKVILAAKTGKEIPLGWAITKDGKPTTNAEEGRQGSVLPIGGAKGSGLAIFVDILCGILSGAAFGPHINNMFTDFKNPQNVGHVFCAIDISKFIDVEQFKTQLQKMIDEIKALPKAEGFSEILMPGEIENRKLIQHKKDGVPIEDDILKELQALGALFNVPCNLT